MNTHNPSLDPDEDYPHGYCEDCFDPLTKVDSISLIQCCKWCAKERWRREMRWNYGHEDPEFEREQRRWRVKVH